MKIRFYIFCIVCTCLTYSPASGKWAKFSDYSNGVGCKGYCTQDSDCNDGQCHVCDTKSHICKKGSKYDGKDYGSYEKCKCPSRKREWATTENKCCPKGEYNSDGHCCPTSKFFNEIIWNPKSNRCDKCKGVGEGELTCGDTEDTVFKCQNGSLVHVETCLNVGMAYRKCENGKCVCSVPPTCDKDRVLNADTCQCECPKDKPFWNGFFCTNRECETAGDCTSIFSDAVEACLRCENNQCKIKTGNICSTDGYVVQTCTADGKISRVSRPCDDNKKCVNGECVCDTEHPTCTLGEIKCSEDEKSALECVTDGDKDNCPTWLTHNCAGEKGTGKCVAGKCEYDDCTPGETRCAPDFPEYAIQTCDDTKKWGGITFRENKCFVCKDGKFENAYATEDAQKECECQAKNLKWCPNTKSCSLENGECPSCEAGQVWDTSNEAKAYTGNRTHISGVGACCYHTEWKENEYGTECCDIMANRWVFGIITPTPVCAKAYCDENEGTWDTSNEAKHQTTEGGCCPKGQMKENEYGTECCSGRRNNWTHETTAVCAKAYCDENEGTWDMSNEAKNPTVNKKESSEKGACCMETWAKNEYGTECCTSMGYNYWKNEITAACAKADCDEHKGTWDTSVEAQRSSSAAQGKGGCCYSWTGTECCKKKDGEWTSRNRWTRKSSPGCCAQAGGHWTNGCDFN